VWSVWQIRVGFSTEPSKPSVYSRFRPVKTKCGIEASPGSSWDRFGILDLIVLPDSELCQGLSNR
jgi:hypothetical protein